VAKRTRTRRRSRFALRWLAVGAIVLVGLLYARPLRSYLSTKHDLARRAADVRALKSERRALQHRLAESSSAEALTKQARRLGLVRPGERLYIVKGVSAWLHGTTIERGGR
jgi:cell division protein FtsB